MKLSSRELSDLLSGSGEKNGCSVAYVLALEGSATKNPTWGFWESVLDLAVQGAQPSPAITHVELCFAPNANAHDDMHFATYLGAVAGWGASFGGQRDFYLGYNAPQWRAVPIVSAGASNRLRRECETHVGTPYSIAKYVCSLPPIRAFSFLFSDVAKSPAHCAILTARCIRAAMPELKMPHHASWFGPTTLFLELDSESRRTAFHSALVASECAATSIVDDECATHALQTLLNGSDDAIIGLDGDACMLAIRNLTLRSLAPGTDDVGKRLLQKQLAIALLRVSVVRNA